MQNESSKLSLDGLLLVDKPLGITSFDVIRQLRRITGVKKIGHAGTLDPLATGLMIILFGTACKKAQHFSKLDKQYRANIHLGFESTTGDEEGDKVSVDSRVPTLEEITSTLQEFVGEIEQIPSVYSAIKINGQEAYKRARAGETVVMPSRTVQIYSAEILRYEYPILEAGFTVSSGTYIRTLAEDIGRRMKVGAYLSGLIRIEIGHYNLGEALDLTTADPTQIKYLLKEL
jgi:tRNA pseudouridine55 synthase